MVNNMKRRKQKANTSKPASSPPLNAPAQALSGDETKRRMALAGVAFLFGLKLLFELKINVGRECDGAHTSPVRFGA